MALTLEQFSNNVTTTLNGSINNSTTSVVVLTGAAMPSTGNFRILIDSEIMKVTARSSNTLTVSRAQEGTSGASHADGATVTLVLTKEAFQSGVADYNLYSTLSDKPTAGVRGRVFRPSDTLFHYYDDGSTWHAFYGTQPVKPPHTAAFTWLNQGGTTSDETRDGIILTVPGNSGDSMRAYVKTAPSTPYIITCAFHLTPNPAIAYATTGIFFRDSGTGRMKFLSSLQDGGHRISLDYWNNATSYAGQDYRQNFTAVTNLHWRQIEDNGTTRYYRYSADGYNWYLLFSEANSTFFTTNQIGIGSSAQATNTGHTVWFVHYEEA